MAIKSFRIAPELQLKVEQAAGLRGINQSEFVRQALEQAVERDLDRGHHLGDAIRRLAVQGSGEPVARRAHEAFGEVIDHRHAR